MSEEKKDAGYVMLPMGKLSFPNFKEKRYNDNDVKKERGKYECNIVFPASADLSALKKAIQEAVKAKWKDSAKALWDAGKIKSPIKSGAQCVDKDGIIYDGYEPDSQVLAVCFYNPMAFMDRYKNKIPSDSDRATEIFFPGCNVMAAVTVATYDNESKGVQARLYAMLERPGGVRIGGDRVGNPDEVFADIAADEAELTGDDMESWED